MLQLRRVAYPWNSTLQLGAEALPMVREIYRNLRKTGEDMVKFSGQSDLGKWVVV